MEKLLKLFCWSAFAILAITGVLKIGSSFQSVPMVYTTDPVIGLRYKTIMWFVGAIEIVVAFILLSPIRYLVKLSFISWLGSCFLAYHLFYRMFGLAAPCPCLGTLTSWLHISRELAIVLMDILSVYLAGFGLLFLVMCRH